MTKMKKSKVLLAGILIVSMIVGTFAGCSSGKVSGGVRLENGEIKGNSVVLSIGDIGIKYSKIRNYCYLLSRQYDRKFSHAVWDYKITDETKIGDEAKEEIIRMVTQLAVIGRTAKSQKITLSGDEKDEAVQKAEEVLASATEEEKKNYFLTVQELSEVFQENLLAEKMFYIATDDADTEISDEEAKQIKIQYIQMITNGTTADGVQIHLGEKEKTDARKKMDVLLAQARKADDFLTMAQENTESATAELTIGRDTTLLDEEAVQAAFQLKKGEFSQVVETPGAYYIIYCVNDNDEDATYTRKEAIIADRQTKMFKEKYADWLGKDEISISKSFWKIFEI